MHFSAAVACKMCHDKLNLQDYNLQFLWQYYRDRDAEATCLHTWDREESKYNKAHPILLTPTHFHD